MKLLRIITIGLLFMTLNSFALTPTCYGERTDLIAKMAEDEDVFSLLFKSQVYAIVSTMTYDAEIAQEDKEQITVSTRELVKDMYKHKMNIDSKFSEFSKLNKEEKSKVMQVIQKAASSKLKAAMGCFALGLAAEIAACGGPALLGWTLTKWNWCMATVLIGDVIAAAATPEAAVVTLEGNGFNLILREEMSFCGKFATSANYGWAGIAVCAVGATIGTVTVCVFTALTNN
jgi:hypothetical protein